MELWFYNNLSAIEINRYIFTSNIAESTNRPFNINYHGACKSLYAFENAIIKLIELNENKKSYNDYNYSSTCE